jgi:hypothetical protein
MKTSILRVSISFIFQLLLNNYTVHAQKWQWSKDGAWNITDIASAQQFDTRSTAVDKNGNSFVIADFRNNHPSAANFCDIDSVKFKSKSGAGICLVSYDCSGALRWMKLMDGLAPNFARSYDMEVDTFGNVYIVVSASLNNTLDTFKIDKDTFLTKSVLKTRSLMLMKYDSLGKLQWLRLPEMDTISNTSIYSYGNSLSVSPNGDVSIYITSIGLRAYEEGKYILPASSQYYSSHVLRYNISGSFIKGTPLEITNINPASFPFIRYAKNHKTGAHFAQCVQVDDFFYNPTFGSTPMTQTSLIAQFDSSGASTWVRQSTSNFQVRNFVFRKPKIDIEGNIYTCFIEKPGYKFSSFNITNSLSAEALPIVIKWNSSGIVQWGQVLNTTDIYYADLGYSENKTVCFVACGAGAKSIGSFSKPAGSFNLVLVVLNAETGAVKSFNSSVAGSLTISVHSVSSDLKGNFYLGGIFMEGLHFDDLGMPYSVRSNVGAAMYFAKFGDSSCEPERLSILQTNNNVKSVYPNPFNNFVVLEGIEKGSTILIKNILGEEEVSFITKQSKVEIPTNNLVSGIHIVSIVQIDGSRFSKVLIKK